MFSLNPIRSYVAKRKADDGFEYEEFIIEFYTTIVCDEYYGIDVTLCAAFPMIDGKYDLENGKKGLIDILNKTDKPYSRDKTDQRWYLSHLNNYCTLGVEDEYAIYHKNKVFRPTIYGRHLETIDGNYLYFQFLCYCKSHNYCLYLTLF